MNSSEGYSRPESSTNSIVKIKLNDNSEADQILEKLAQLDEKLDSVWMVERDGVQMVSIQADGLDSTKLASRFFHDASDCIHYGEHWNSISANIKEILKKKNITQISYDIDGAYFEPETYLLRYPELIRAGINPLKHFQKNGKSEKRIPC